VTTSSTELGPGLERRALGFVPVLFQSIVFAGPAVGVALSLVFLASYAGGATPLATILTTLAILLIAVSIGELGSKLPSAGGLYTYVAAGLGDAWGFMLSWLLGAAYLIIDAGLIALLLGLIAQENLTSQLGAPSWLWAPIVVFCICVATGLVISGIKPSAKVQVVMGVFEMAVFSVLAVWLIIKAGNRNTLSAFSPHDGNANGWGSIFAAMIYGVLAFAGFESAAFLAEEAREPRRAVRRAVIGSVVLIGVFWTLTMYAGVVFWGPRQIDLGKDRFVAYNGGDPWDGIAHLVWGGAWVLVLIAVLNSTWASLIGEFNAGSRVAFALGRVNLLSPHAARTHRKLRTPWIAAIGLAVIAIAVSLTFGFALSGPKPLGATLFLGALVTLLFIPIYMLVALSCPFYFWRHHRDEFNVIKHGVLPVGGVGFFVPVLIASLGINFAGLGIAPLHGPARYAPWIALVWIATGIVVYTWLLRRRPETIDQLDRVFIVEEHAALRRVTTLAAEGAEAESLYALVAEQVGEVLRVPLVSILRYEQDGTATERASFSRLEGRLGSGTRWSLEGTSVVSEVLRSGHPARIDDYGGLAGEIAETVRRTGIRSTVGIPIVVAGRLWGAMVVSSTEPDPLHEETEARLTNFTELVATAIANAEVSERIERLAQEQAALRRVATLIARAASAEEVFSAVAEEVASVLNLQVVTVCRYQKDVVVVLSSLGIPAFPAGSRWPLDGQSLPGSVYRTGGPVRVDDFTDELTGAFGIYAMARDGDLKSGLGVPIVVDGAVWGSVNAGSTEERGFPAEAEERLARFTDLVATSVQNATMREQLVASRARVVAAADESRRRIERDLHDGAQQRFVSLALSLRLAQAQLRTNPEGAAEILSAAREELAHALAELQELARGIHPAALTLDGLRTALVGLTERAPIPVQIMRIPTERLPEAVEVAIYYLVAEAVTNVAKYAQATRATIVVDRLEGDGSVAVTVEDDGVGGADASNGTGLVGLTDRIEALGGRLGIESPPGRGTRLTATIPCRG
jgi:amino acid transporter/putative methionine-R-sulfoxide reductase with GAF domain